LSKNTTQCPRPGLEPGSLDPEASALTMRPPRLPHYFVRQMINLNQFLIMWLFKLLYLTLFHSFCYFFFFVIIYFLCFASVLVFFLWRFCFYLCLATEKSLFFLVVLSAFLLMDCLFEQVWRWSSLRLNCRFRTWKDAL